MILIRLLYYLPMERMNKKELEKLKDFKVYAFEWDVYVKAEDYKEIAIENKKLKEERDNCLKEVKLCYNDIHSLEWQISDLEKENKTLKEERIFSLGEYDYMILTSTTPQLKIIKKNQNYSLMEEDTLQELRDLGEI